MHSDRIRQSLRTLARHKRFVAMAVVCLGVAIALNTTMYSVLDALLKPKSDVHEPHRLVGIQYYGDYRQVIPQHEKNAALFATAFHEGIAGSFFTDDAPIAERGARIREVLVRTVTPNYMGLLRLHADGGRLLDGRDAGSTERPIVIGERLWKQLFPERERFEPSSILIGGTQRRIVGILPRSSGFAEVDAWQLPLPDQERGVRWGLARLKPGVTIEQARAELSTVSDRFRQMTGEGRDAGWRVLPYERRAYGDWSFHYALIGSVVAVLLIACANLANLQLARGVSRARELATRSAVGASRSDIVWQLVLESSWLALGGLVLGAVLTLWGVYLIDAYVPREVSDFIGYPSINWRVMLFGVAVTVLCLGLVGLLPALKLSRVNISELMKSGAGTGRSRSARRQYGALVIVEVSLALALLCATGLLVRSAYQVRAFDYSEDFRDLVFGGVRLTSSGPADTRTRREWSETLIRQALSTDSVIGAATAATGAPSRRAVTAYDAAGQPVSLPAPMWSYSIVSPDYFRVSKIPIIQGRDFSPGEFAEAQVIVDSVAARSLWPGRNAIGQQLKLDSAHTNAPWYRVVGVAGQRWRYFTANADMQVLEQANAMRPTAFRGAVYVLNTLDTARVGATTGRNQYFASFLSVVVRARGHDQRLPMLLRNKLAELGPNVRPSYPRSWEQSTGIAYFRARHDFMATLFGLFALFALALAGLGVYSIIAHMVAQRTREFGLRMAIGAAARDIRQMVQREGNILTLLGIAIGLLITYKTAGWVRAFVFSDWDRFDSRVFAVVALVLFATAWLASYLPARRAMRINPVEALRND